MSHLVAKIKNFIPISKILVYINKVLYSVDIDYRANLAGGFKMVHGIGIVIGAEVVSLGHLTVYQGVTIGGNGSEAKEHCEVKHRQPIIEPNVVIYSDAAILVPILIGKNSSV